MAVFLGSSNTEKPNRIFRKILRNSITRILLLAFTVGCSNQNSNDDGTAVSASAEAERAPAAVSESPTRTESAPIEKETGRGQSFGFVAPEGFEPSMTRIVIVNELDADIVNGRLQIARGKALDLDSLKEFRFRVTEENVNVYELLRKHVGRKIRVYLMPDIPCARCEEAGDDDAIAAAETIDGQQRAVDSERSVFLPHQYRFPYLATITCKFGQYSFSVGTCLRGKHSNAYLELRNGHEYGMYSVYEVMSGMAPGMQDASGEWKIPLRSGSCLNIGNRGENMLINVKILDRENDKEIFEKSAPKFESIDVCV